MVMLVMHAPCDMAYGICLACMAVSKAIIHVCMQEGCVATLLDYDADAVKISQVYTKARKAVVRKAKAQQPPPPPSQDSAVSVVVLCD